MGKFAEIQTDNRDITENYDPGLYSFVRWSADEKLIVVCNFSWLTTSTFELKIPANIIKEWKLKDGSYTILDQLYKKNSSLLLVKNGLGTMNLSVLPSESLIFKVNLK